MSLNIHLNNNTYKYVYLFLQKVFFSVIQQFFFQMIITSSCNKKHSIKKKSYIKLHVFLICNFFKFPLLSLMTNVTYLFFQMINPHKYN